MALIKYFHKVSEDNTNHDIARKRGPVTKLWQEKQTNVKKTNDDAMLANWDVIVIFPVYGQFGAILKPDSGRIICKTYIFIKSNPFYFTKTESRTRKSLTQL